MTKKVINVLLVDDHPVVRAGFCRMLESTNLVRVVAEADNGEAGCQLYMAHKPDVVILDLNMPGGIDGFETIHRIIMKNPDARILVFSMHTNQTLIQRALELGATGYIAKNCTAESMLQAVHSVKAGKTFIDPELASDMIANLTHGKILKNPLDILTKREFQIFRLIAEGNSSKEIAALISISPKTVRVHHSNIMRKLKLQNKIQFVLLAISCNILQEESPPPHHPTECDQDEAINRAF
jgi:two-component system, NarL family, invasion response regulator UvrY